MELNKDCWTADDRDGKAISMLLSEGGIAYTNPATVFSRNTVNVACVILHK